MRIRINKYYLLFFGIVFRYLLPYYFKLIMEESFVIDSLLTLLSLGLMAWFIISSKKPFKPMLFLFSVPYILFILSTILNGGSLYSALVQSVTVLLLCAVVGIVMDSDEKKGYFLRVIRDITLFFFVMNLVVITVLPNGIASITPGISPYYLYGNANTVIRQILPGLCCSCLIDYRANKKISVATGVFILGFVYSLVVSYFSATSFVALLFLVLWSLFMKPISAHKKAVYIIILLMVAYIELSVVISLGNTSLSDFITGIFNKSSDFSGRIRLWRNAWNYFKQSPILGHGLEDGNKIAYMIGNTNGSHNYYLDLLYQRGILGFFSTMCIILLPVFKLKKAYRISEGVCILMGFCCACMLMFLVEPFYTSEYLIIPIFYAFLTVLCKREDQKLAE